ncbi:uncharacterized protein LOC106012815 [Aplysia californica]|uniref:Uncharacterized protein LOC106012815 n=1 Tax=Aplysia californica TaxID=6500 RepID=A0ABM1A7I3_APLCA|nr:uncharacterized protein LOC106012815 [Aplysia californica]
MKVVAILAVVAFVTVQADFVAYLKEIQTHRSFQSLSIEDKVLFAELVQAAETDTLQAFIDRVTLLKVVELMDRMYYVDAQKFSGYLAEHLGYHHHTDTVKDDIINKRDDDDDDDDDDDLKFIQIFLVIKCQYSRPFFHFTIQHMI